MSAIPPNIIGSVLQSGDAQRTQATDRDKAENAKAQAARDAGRTSAGEDILEVEATDADTQVHTDSGGLGGQGRHDAPPEEEEAQPQPEAPDGITIDEEGRPHLDLSA
ncbi:MAG: hypothetical protein MI923_13475 [Phycisphaerales bacterium]|nr:hypothetical protein [Phycisphaerales bacterium]